MNSQTTNNSNLYDLLNDNSSKVYSDYEKEADILNSQISKKNVNNVAVVAKYGAGKSSAINTYLRKYRSKELNDDADLNKLGDSKKNNYVRISLSTFNKVKYDEQAIERSILQQLLYCRKKNKLPNSKIERTNKSSIWKTILWVVIFVIFVIFSFFTGLGFAKKDEKEPLEIFSYDWLKYLYLMIAVISFSVLFSFLLHNRYLKKFKYKDLEADLVSDKDNNTQYTNLINKFIDEVLYFFECIDVNLVIFEDLDRLPTTEIFAKLRELNLIINNSGKKSNKVTFLYAVKDDLFKTEEERAKFFDFIFPIIPVINPITAKVKIEEKSEKIKKYNIDMELSGKLIRGISVFVPDMRILNNTFNDYILMYDKILNDEKAPDYLSNDKLFALCLYKNLFPYDYALLEKNEGLIPLVINISNLKSKCLKELDTKIQALQEKIKEKNDLKIQSFKELHGLFLLELGKLNYNNYYSGSIDPWALTTFKGINQKELCHPKYLNRRIELPGGADVVGPKGEKFEDLEQKIIDKSNGELEKIREKLNDLEKDKQTIIHWNFERIVKENGVDFCFPSDLLASYYKNSKENKIEDYKEKPQVRYLKFMIGKGFIDEHYIEYTSNYKSKILSLADTVLIQKINASETTFDDLIVNLEQVLRLLEDDEFSKEHIIIKVLLDNLGVIRKFSFEERDSKFANLIHLLKEVGKEKVKENLIKYINISEEAQCEFLLAELLKGDLAFGTQLINEENIIFERKNLILKDLIKNNENFVFLKDNAIISDFLAYNENYLELLENVNDDTKVYNLLNIVNPEIFRLTLGKENHNIQKYLISHNMYEINLNNLEIILLNDNNHKEFYSSNYSFILSTDLKEYIQTNLEKYINKILLNEEISCDEEEQIKIEELLKNEEISIETRLSLLNKVNIKIENISEYSQELYTTLLKNDLIISSWFNIEYAYERIGFDSVKNLLQKADVIDGDFVGLEQISIETPLHLINDILSNMNSSDLEKVSDHLPVTTTLSGLSLEKIADDNLAIFIRKGHITFDMDDLNKLLNYSTSLNEYLLVYKQEVLDNFDHFFDIALPEIDNQRVYENGRYVNKQVINAKDTSQQVVKKVISCERIALKIKTILIEKCQEIININNYEDEMAKYIIENNLPVPSNILWQFSNSEKVSKDDKKKILNICLGKVDIIKDKKELELYLQNLGKDYNDFIVNDKPLNIEPNSIEDKIFEFFKEKKIYSKRKNKDIFVIKKL